MQAASGRSPLRRSELRAGGSKSAKNGTFQQSCPRSQLFVIKKRCDVYNVRFRRMRNTSWLVLHVESNADVCEFEASNRYSESWLKLSRHQLAFVNCLLRLSDLLTKFGCCVDSINAGIHYFHFQFFFCFCFFIYNIVIITMITVILFQCSIYNIFITIVIALLLSLLLPILLFSFTTLVTVFNVTYNCNVVSCHLLMFNVSDNWLVTV